MMPTPPNRQAEMESSDVVASLAVTLDGYIARTDGSVDYLENYPMDEASFNEFRDSVGALIMGRSTYEVTLGFGWIWGDMPTMVLTTRTGLDVPGGADVTFASQTTSEAIRLFSAETPKRLWVMGGGKVVTDGLNGGAVDTLDVTVIPEAIGTGIPLFTEPYSGPMRLIEHTNYSNGLINLVYNTKPE